MNNINLSNELRIIYEIMKQYRDLTNEFINDNISNKNIKLFIEEHYFKVDDRISDYSYDLWSYIDTGVIEEAIKRLGEDE